MIGKKKEMIQFCSCKRQCLLKGGKVKKEKNMKKKERMKGEK